MTVLKIERSREGDAVVFTLSGRIGAERVAELQNLLESTTESTTEGCRIVLDLREVDLVDRDTVRFLARCLAAGIELTHCPGYVREWIARSG